MKNDSWDEVGKKMKEAGTRAGNAMKKLGISLNKLQGTSKEATNHIPDNVKRKLHPPFSGMVIPDKPYK